MTARAETLEKIASLAGEGYKYGFFTDIESEQAPLGLNKGTVYLEARSCLIPISSADRISAV